MSFTTEERISLVKGKAIVAEYLKVAIADLSYEMVGRATDILQTDYKRF